MNKTIKFLTTLLLLAVSVGAWAEEVVTITASESLTGIASTDQATVEPFTFTFAKNEGSTSPTYNASGKDIRLYAKGTLKINTTGNNMTRVVFSLSTQGKKRLAAITASVGTIAKQAKGDETVTWTGDANEVTFTVGNSATYGSDGSSKAGQLCFTAIEITSKSSEQPQTVSIPTFSPVSGTRSCRAYQ